MRKYKKPIYESSDRTPISYSIQNGSKIFQYTGNDLYRLLLERSDLQRAIKLQFKILREGLPEYVWDELYMQIANDEITEEYIIISEKGLRQFLQELDYQYINRETAAKFESFREPRLKALDSRVLVNGYEPH